MQIIVETGNPLLPRILAKSCVTPLPEICREGLRIIVLVSLIEGDFLVSTICRMVHPIPTSPLNDFCTCSTYFQWFAYKRNYAHAYMHRLEHCTLIFFSEMASK